MAYRRHDVGLLRKSDDLPGRKHSLRGAVTGLVARDRPGGNRGAQLPQGVVEAVVLLIQDHNVLDRGRAHRGRRRRDGKSRRRDRVVPRAVEGVQRLAIGR